MLRNSFIVRLRALQDKGNKCGTAELCSTWDYTSFKLPRVNKPFVPCFICGVLFCHYLFYISNSFGVFMIKAFPGYLHLYVFLLNFQQWFTEIFQWIIICKSPSELFHFSCFDVILLGDVADVVGNNNNNSSRFAEIMIKSWKSDCNSHVQLALLKKDLRHKYIEDIYSFVVNTINIFIECNENISIFMSAKHEWKIECFHYTGWKYL